ncbi:MAG: HD domain-containing protein [Candidatus Hodarchaeota archaeon]
MLKEIFSILKNKARSFLENETGAHEWGHVERVFQLAKLVTKDLYVDWEVLEPAIWLHDIARPREASGQVRCHAQEGARMVAEILGELDYPLEKIEQVCYAISVHRYRTQLKAKTLEAQVLQDVDRLDALGAIGIARVFTMGGMKHRPIYDPKIPPNKIYESDASTSLNHFFEKILKITPDSFNTPAAQKIAKERYNFTKMYIDRFLKELQKVDLFQENKNKL